MAYSHIGHIPFGVWSIGLRAPALRGFAFSFAPYSVNSYSKPSAINSLIASSALVSASFFALSSSFARSSSSFLIC